MDEESGIQTAAHGGRVYVLRVWYEQGDGPLRRQHWRGSLREGTHGERRHFANIDDCIEHLYSELARC